MRFLSALLAAGIGVGGLCVLFALLGPLMIAAPAWMDRISHFIVWPVLGVLAIIVAIWSHR